MSMTMNWKIIFDISIAWRRCDDCWTLFLFLVFGSRRVFTRESSKSISLMIFFSSHHKPMNYSVPIISWALFTFFCVCGGFSNLIVMRLPDWPGLHHEADYRSRLRNPQQSIVSHWISHSMRPIRNVCAARPNWSREEEETKSVCKAIVRQFVNASPMMSRNPHKMWE